MFSFLTFTVTILLQSTANAKRTPILVFELYRHGARYPQADAVSPPLGAFIPEELTGNGIRQQYMLGQKIITDYPFIGSSTTTGNLPSNVTKVYASYSQRTYLSALAHMQGMFPPGTGQKITVAQSQFWLPPQQVSTPFVGGTDTSFSLPYGERITEIVSASKGDDKLFLENWNNCQAFYSKSTNQYNQFAKKHIKDIEPFRKSIKGTRYASLIKPNEFGDLKQLFHIADGEEAYYNLKGKHMDDIDDKIAGQANLLRAINNIAFTGTGDDILRMRTFPFVKKIVKYIDSKLQKPKEYENLRYVGFSGHQSNLIPFLLKLGLTSEECLFKLLNEQKVEGVCEPNSAFASNIVWEVSKDDTTGEIFVQVKYNGKDVKTCKNDTTEELACKYSEFKEFMEKEYYLDKKTLDHFCSKKPPPGMTLGILLCMFFLVVMFVVVMAQCGFLCFYYKENKKLKKQVRNKGPPQEHVGRKMYNNNSNGSGDEEFYVPMHDLDLNSSVNN